MALPPEADDVTKPDLLEAETKRQKFLLDGAISFIRRDSKLTPEEKEHHLLKLNELMDFASEVKSGKKTMDEFWEFQETRLEMPDYIFLSETVEGLTTNWWRLIMAQIDPLKDGPAIQVSYQVRGTIGKRSAKT